MFRDRIDAGARLAERLGTYKNRDDVIVLALPRGGVVTGYEIARLLNVPLDVFIVRKIGVPGREELAMGAVAETGAVVLNDDIIGAAGLPEEVVRRATEEQKQVIKNRISLYRGGRGGLAGLENKVVLLVDDGVATGATMKAAIIALKEQKILKLVAALPVGPPETVAVLRTMVDECVCLEQPPLFMAVGVHYLNFTQVSDKEVMDLLKTAASMAA